MADKKQKRKTSAEQKKAYNMSTLNRTIQIILNVSQYIINRMRQQFTVGDLSSCIKTASLIIISSIEFCHAAHVRCRHGVTIRQEVGPV